MSKLAGQGASNSKTEKAFDRRRDKAVLRNGKGKDGWLTPTTRKGNITMTQAIAIVRKARRDE